MWQAVVLAVPDPPLDVVHVGAVGFLRVAELARRSCRLSGWRVVSLFALGLLKTPSLGGHEAQPFFAVNKEFARANPYFDCVCTLRLAVVLSTVFQFVRVHVLFG